MLEVPEIKSNNIDKGTKFNSLSIIENEYDGEFEYICNYDIDLKFKDVKIPEDRRLEEYINNNIIKDKRRLAKSYEKRPNILFDMNIITKEDTEVGTVDEAIDDFLKQNKNNLGILFNLIDKLFNYNIPQKVVNNIVSNGEVELTEKRKVKRIEYNYKKIEIDRISVSYEDGKTVTVDLPKIVTDKTVDNVIPGESLLSLYSKQTRWLREDYESTIELFNEIFGVNLETLKGGKVIW